MRTRHWRKMPERSNFMLKNISSIFLLIALSAFCACSPLDKFVYKNGGYGMVTEGSVGIVWIGQNFKEAEKVLIKEGLRKNTSCLENASYAGGLFKEHKIPLGSMECCFDDLSWRRGTFCISNKEGEVASIVWAYQPGPDF